MRLRGLSRKSLPEYLFFSRVSRVSRRFGRETRRKATRLPRARRLPARVCGHPSALAVLMPAPGAIEDVSPYDRRSPRGAFPPRRALGCPGWRQAPWPGQTRRWTVIGRSNAAAYGSSVRGVIEPSATPVRRPGRRGSGSIAQRHTPSRSPSDARAARAATPCRVDAGRCVPSAASRAGRSVRVPA